MRISAVPGWLWASGSSPPAAASGEVCVCPEDSRCLSVACSAPQPPVPGTSATQPRETHTHTHNQLTWHIQGALIHTRKQAGAPFVWFSCSPPTCDLIGPESLMSCSVLGFCVLEKFNFFQLWTLCHDQKKKKKLKHCTTVTPSWISVSKCYPERSEGMHDLLNEAAL